MSQYMLLFRVDVSALAAAGPQTPEEMKADLDRWVEWIGSVAAQGHFISTERLGQEGKVVRQHGNLVTDGPFIEVKELLGGYMLVQADSLDQAVEISKGCPIFRMGGHVEVRPIIPM